MILNIYGFFGLTPHKEGKRCGQGGQSPCYSQSEVIYPNQVLDLELQWFSGKNIIFGFFSSPL